jgi:hypothetical protein
LLIPAIVTTDGFPGNSCRANLIRSETVVAAARLAVDIQSHAR